MAEGVEDLPITDRLVSWFKDRIHLEWSDCRITRVYKSTGYVDKKPFIVIQHCGSPLGRCGYLVKDEDDMKAVESLCRQPPAAPEGPGDAPVTITPEDSPMWKALREQQKRRNWPWPAAPGVVTGLDVARKTDEKLVEFWAVHTGEHLGIVVPDGLWRQDTKEFLDNFRKSQGADWLLPRSEFEGAMKDVPYIKWDRAFTDDEVKSLVEREIQYGIEHARSELADKGIDAKIGDAVGLQIEPLAVSVPKCDCGAAHTREPHAHWCSTRKHES